MPEEIEDDPEVLAVLRGIREEAVGVRTDLDELKVKQTEDRRTLRILSGLMAAKLVTLIVLFFLIFQVLSLVNQVDDCLPPDGKCAERNALSTQLIILSASYQTEVQRLTTEIQVGESTGQTESLAIRRQRLSEVSNVLQHIGENLKDVQASRKPRNQIPTELASSPNQETK